MTRLKIISSLLLAGYVFSFQAFAQDVVMRRPIPGQKSVMVPCTTNCAPETTTPTPTPSVTPTPTPTPTSSSTPTPSPSATISNEFYYYWWSGDTPACDPTKSGAAPDQTCNRQLMDRSTGEYLGDSEVVDDQLCADSKSELLNDGTLIPGAGKRVTFEESCDSNYDDVSILSVGSWIPEVGSSGSAAKPWQLDPSSIPSGLCTSNAWRTITFSCSAPGGPVTVEDPTCLRRVMGYMQLVIDHHKADGFEFHNGTFWENRNVYTDPAMLLSGCQNVGHHSGQVWQCAATAPMQDALDAPAFGYMLDGDGQAQDSWLYELPRVRGWASWSDSSSTTQDGNPPCSLDGPRSSNEFYTRQVPFNTEMIGQCNSSDPSKKPKLICRQITHKNYGNFDVMETITGCSETGAADTSVHSC